MSEDWPTTRIASPTCSGILRTSVWKLRPSRQSAIASKPASRLSFISESVLPMAIGAGRDHDLNWFNWQVARYCLRAVLD